ncbi:energy-coupled thiamine transporter ThiT [Sporohalobacter salinus]|uniref:energy-coupled thiamine transporter ThiT n=1 Tax=Sporohalobacter salinus TaxID=1494606 RepID=UPI00195F4CEE|nr:energy-coupled thiamine transporter ThiT [Sporohalobacter salinus]MBM7624141.1 thiamine transporter [Sporohalobacter salinus]
MNNKKVKRLTELGIALALATLLHFVRIYQLPQGGSVSLEMIPIFFIALRWGLKEGITLGCMYGILQLILGAKIFYPSQAILDYPVAFSSLGLAGIVHNWTSRNNFKENGMLITGGVILAGGIRFLIHVISGVIFFGEYAPEGQNVWIYSLGYNASYMLPEIVITIVVMIFLVKSSSSFIATK